MLHSSQLPVCSALLVAIGWWGLAKIAGAEDVAVKTAAAGAIDGAVTYRPDSKRPWRYARYYVKHAKTGELAEAVVALRKGLKSDGSRSRPPP
jgi:hypothetical protein